MKRFNFLNTRNLFLGINISFSATLKFICLKVYARRMRSRQSNILSMSVREFVFLFIVGRKTLSRIADLNIHYSYNAR